MSALGSLELLAAGFSASFGVEVLPPGAAIDGASNVAPQKLTIHDLFHISHSMVPREMPATTDGEIEVFIQGLTGATTMVRVTTDTTIEEMKKMASEKLEISKTLKFMFDRRALEDEKTVGMEGISNGSTVNYIILSEDRKLDGVFQMDTALLARNKDYDFTRQIDGDKVFMRGQYRYHRPCGWYRYAVAVKNAYGDDTWLGPDGIRTETSAGEWPVSYHGTKMRDEGEVVRKFREGPEAVYIKGVYSSPSLAMVDEFYAQIFEFEGNRYKIALQNRINPDKAGGHMKIIPADQTEVGADYWISPMEDQAERVFDVRPYGIIIKQI